MKKRKWVSALLVMLLCCTGFFGAAFIRLNGKTIPVLNKWNWFNNRRGKIGGVGYEGYSQTPGQY